jgi:hypothetical protein
MIALICIAVVVFIGLAVGLVVVGAERAERRHRAVREQDEAWRYAWPTDHTVDPDQSTPNKSSNTNERNDS